MTEYTSNSRWLHLVAQSERLSELIREKKIDGASALEDELRDTVQSILEAFPRELEPTSDLEGYAVRRLGKALGEVLDALAKCRSK